MVFDSSLFIFNFKIVKEHLELVLGCQAGVNKVFIGVPPLCQSSIVEHSKFVSNDERHDVVGKTFFEHQQTSHSPIAVLKRMNPLELYMKVDDFFQCMLPAVVIVVE